MDTKYFTLIDGGCNDRDAFDFDPHTCGSDSRTRRIGHLIRFSFPAVQKAMVQDLILTNPENPEVKDPAVGAIDFIRWEGAPNDNMDLGVKISFQNRAILQEALSCTNETPEFEVEFVVYDYDYNKKTYFKRFYTVKNPIKFSISEASRLNIYEEPDNYIKKPIVFFLQVSLTPMNGIKDQEVGFAFSSTSPKFTREVGESNVLTLAAR